MNEDGTHTTIEVCRMTGTSYRQLDYWCRTGRIPGQPVGRGTGSGHRRAWTDAQIERAALLAEASKFTQSLDDAVAQLESRRAVG